MDALRDLLMKKIKELEKKDKSIMDMVDATNKRCDQHDKSIEYVKR